MALMNCTECGKEISDKADKCPHCGAPVEKNTYSRPEVQNVSVEQKTPKNSTISIVSLVLSILGCTFFIGLILAIIDLTKKDGRKKTISIISIVICCLWFFILVYPSDESEQTPEPTVIESTETVTSNKEYEEKADEIIENLEEIASELSVNEETEIEETEEPIVLVSKEDFIASCQDIPYKTLARNPEDYIGTPIVLTVKIEQILQGGFFDDNQYYRVYTNDEFDLWLGDEYFMYDERIDDDMRLLETDIIKVYGEFLGTETVERALTGTKEEVPSFKALYVELISE